jgi:hypothetical protein
LAILHACILFFFITKQGPDPVDGTNLAGLIYALVISGISVMYGDISGQQTKVILWVDSFKLNTRRDVVSRDVIGQDATS